MIDLTAQIARQQRAASRRAGLELAIEGVRRELAALEMVLDHCEKTVGPTVRVQRERDGAVEQMDRAQMIAGVKDGMARLRAQLVRLEARQLARGDAAS